MLIATTKRIAITTTVGLLMACGPAPAVAKLIDAASPVLAQSSSTSTSGTTAPPAK